MNSLPTIVQFNKVPKQLYSILIELTLDGQATIALLLSISSKTLAYVDFSFRHDGRALRCVNFSSRFTLQGIVFLNRLIVFVITALLAQAFQIFAGGSRMYRGMAIEHTPSSA